MQIETLVSSYGYLALWIGTFLEGETILVIGGLAAHQGYLKLTGVIVAAFAGSLMGDQFFFYLGRRHSRFILEKRPAWQPRIDKVHRLLERYETITILSFRFLYGLRSITPFVLGMSRVRLLKFVILNAVGALVWAVTVGMGGYFFGHAVENLIGEIKQYEGYFLLMISLTGTCVWLVHFRYHR